MEKYQQRINISAPNLINICVDDNQQGEISGRLYHYYNTEPVRFENIVELIRETENLFDVIAFPQASTRTRKFIDQGKKSIMPVQRPARVVRQEELLKNTGCMGTFITSVRYRQNSTWQGEFYWAENDVKRQFSNLLDFIRQIDTALEMKNVTK